MWESLKTLETVSCHPEIRAQLDNPISAHLLMKCINSNNENLVQVALSTVVQFESHENFMVLIKSDPRFELIGKLCHFRNPKIAQMAAVLSNRLSEVEGDVKPPMDASHQTPGMFVNGGVQWGDTGPHGRTENGSNNSHLNDVVDLDATTAQYRNDSFIKSPSSLPVVPPGGGGAAPPLQPSPHQQYSPRYHAPSPHHTSSYNGVAFPTTYSSTPNYTTQSSYHAFPAYQQHTAYQPPPPTNRNWYTAI